MPLSQMLEFWAAARPQNDRVLMRPVDAKIHGLGKRRLHRRFREKRERIASDGPVMLGTPDRILQSPMLGHQADGMLQVCVSRFAPFQRPPPKLPFAVAATAEGKHYRQCDLALAEIVADILSELRRRAAIIKDIVDQLKGDAEIHAERPAGGLLVALAAG